jgi:phage baseplate assembly protein V
MASEAIKFGWMQHLEKQVPEKKIYGTTSCTVVNNIDCTGQARVQLSLPWLPGFQPWARIAKQSEGTYFAPQIDDEVLVSFHNGDVREPLVVGAVSSMKAPPPTQVPADALTKRKICTPQGLELEFDDALQSVTLTNTNKSTQASTKTTLRLDTKKAEISTPEATVTVGITGDVAITSKTKITLKAPTIEIKADTLVTIEGPAAELKASAKCEITGKPVKIN